MCAYAVYMAMYIYTWVDLSVDTSFPAVLTGL